MNDALEDPVLVAVAKTIADGLPVDWDSLIEEHPELAKDLRELRVLQEVQAARRQRGTVKERNHD